MINSKKWLKNNPSVPFMSTLLILDTLQVQNVGDTVTSVDIKNVSANNVWALTNGIKTGALFGSISIILIFSIGYALTNFFGMRKEHLIIKYHGE